MDILQNLVHMTGQRDHLRLEFSGALHPCYSCPMSPKYGPWKFIPLKASSGAPPYLAARWAAGQIPILIFCMTHNASL